MRNRNEELDFVTVMGEVFAEVLSAEAGISDASGHDYYSAIVGGTHRPVSVEEFRSWGPPEFERGAIALNRYFEINRVTSAHVAGAVAGTLKAWGG